MSEDIEDIEGKIVEQLQKCQDTLMVCVVENRKCKRCKEKGLCLLYIRSVLASLCKIEIARFNMEETEAPSGLYV